jgi:hypothetical protein
MKTRRKSPQFHEGPEAAVHFDAAISRILTVSKPELERREAEYQDSMKDKPRRGPKRRKTP